MDEEAENRRKRVAVEVFRSYCERNPDEQAAFLAEACADDSALRAEVEELIKADEQAGDFLEKPSIKSQGVGHMGSLAGQTVAGYRVVREIGEGGQGVVYEAIQDVTEQTVALKIMKPGIASTSVMRRFETESRVLGWLEHPGIARVYHAGTHTEGPFGVPFFAMEYVHDSRNIVEYAQAERMSVRDRLALFAEVCDAVEHGHKNSIIHRDLKPTNILVDSSGQAKVIDFGIARVTDSDLAVTSLQTGSGSLMGTLQYMSPEQVSGEASRIDTRSDVYSLGVVVYQLVSGCLPYDASSTPIDKAIRTIREEPPRRLASVDRALRGDVDTIALKTLEKNPKRRYQSAAELAEDIRRFIRGEPIAARADSPIYMARKRLWKHRIPAAVILAFGFVFVSAVILLWNRNVALRYQLYVENIARAQNALEDNNAGLLKQMLDKCPDNLRGWEWRYLRYVADTSDISFDSGQGAVTSLTFSPDGTRIATGGLDTTVGVWNAGTGGYVASLARHEAAVTSVAYSLDGQYIASGGEDQVIWIWDAIRGQPLHTLTGHRSSVSSVTFNPSGDWIASTGNDNSVRVWDWLSGREIWADWISEPQLLKAVFIQDGQIILTCNHSRALKAWDAGGRQVWTARATGDYKATSVAAGLQGKFVVLGGDDTMLHVVNPKTGTKSYPLTGHQGPVNAVSVSRDGYWIASGSADTTVRLWNIFSRRASAILRGHESAVRTVTFSSDGQSLASADSTGTVKIWETLPGAIPMRWTAGYGTCAEMAFSPDGTKIVTAGRDHCLRIWDTGTGELLATLRGHTEQVHAVAWDSTGERIISGSEDYTVRLWNALAEEKPTIFSGHSDTVFSVIYDEKRDRIISGSRDETVIVWDVSTRDELFKLGVHGGRVYAVAISRDWAMIATATEDGTVRLWGADQGVFLFPLSGHRQGAHCLAYSPDGRHLVSGGADNTIRMWDLASRGEIWNRPGHTGVVLGLAFSPDGRRIISGGRDSTIKLWDADTGVELLTLCGDCGLVKSVSFGPDGGRLAALSSDGTMRIWETEKPPRDTRYRRHQITLARAIVDSVFEKETFVKDVVAAIQGDGELSESVAELAVGIARDLGDNPYRISEEAWQVVRQPSRAMHEYREALHKAEYACSLSAGSPTFLNTLGVAQYRVGQYRAALASLRQSNKLRGGSRPQDVAFLAMTLHRLGRHGEATEEFDRLRALMREEPHVGHSWLHGLLNEAEQMIEGSPEPVRPGT